MTKDVKCPFKVGYVDSEDLGVFEHLIMPHLCEEIEQGEEYIILGLVSQDCAAGVLILDVDEGVLQIIDFYILPQYRNMGGAKMLLQVVEKLAGKQHMWITVHLIAVDSEIRLLSDTLLHAGYELRIPKESHSYLVTLSTCQESADLNNKKVEPGIKSFRELSEAKLKSVTKYAKDMEATLPKEGFFRKTLDRDISVVYEAKNGNMGFLAVEHVEYMQGIRLVSAFNGSDNPMVMLWLLRAALKEAVTKYDSDTPLLIDVADDLADKFVRYVLEDVTDILFIYDKLPDEV